MDKKLLTEALKTKNTVTFFYADWCGGCKVTNPMVQQVRFQQSSLTPKAKLLAQAIPALQ